VNQTQTPLRLVGYTVEGKSYWIATSRFDLTAEQIALIYKLRWQIEMFFAWWKRHLKVYHLISKNRHGLMIQMLACLITSIFLAIYCEEQHGEPVSIRQVYQLRNQILNASRMELSDDHAGAGKTGSHTCKPLAGHCWDKNRVSLVS